MTRPLLRKAGMKLKLFLQGMLRLVRRLVVDVHVRPLHVWHALKLHLQFFSDIVRDFHCLGLVDYNVYLDNDSRPAVVCPDSVDGTDCGRVGHSW